MIGGLAAGALSYNTSSNSSRDQVKPEPRTSVTPEPTQAAAFKTYDAEPQLGIDLDKQYTAVIKTKDGEIRVKLLPAAAPRAVNSFVFLARDGFYNGLSFYRVIPDFVAQAGDPSCDAAGKLQCTGAGGPGYVLPVEGTQQHSSGVVALGAISGSSNVNGSQFYVLDVNQPSLDGRDSIIGLVVDGLDLVQGLAPRNPCFGPAASDAVCQQDAPPGIEILGIDILES